MCVYRNYYSLAYIVIILIIKTLFKEETILYKTMSIYHMFLNIY